MISSGTGVSDPFDPASAPARSVLRAADELRRASPVIMTAFDRQWLCLPVMGAGLALAQIQSRLGAPDLLISKERAAILKIRHKGAAAVRLELPEGWGHHDIEAAADPEQDLATPLKGPFKAVPSHPGDEAVLKLMKLGGLLPAALIWPWSGGRGDLLHVGAEDIMGFDRSTANALMQVAAAQLPVANAENSRLIAFRPALGGREHYALVIGELDPSTAILTRLHSECFTGDLLGSLKCDCGDQLKGAIAAIGREGSGVLLYLAQEGRGIGLVSKLKAYALQDQGFDTVDANLRLGFGVDEREFQPAADMLKALGVTSVRLMTNNPDKVAQLETKGITVAERVPHIFQSNAHNSHYLDTKRDRTGHYL